MIRRSRLWLWLLLAALAVAGVMRLRLDVEVFNLLPADEAPVQGLRIFQQHFANARELILTVQASDAEQTEAAAQALATRLRAVTNLVARVTWRPPWLENPAQAAELIASLWFNQPPEVFAELAGRLAPGRVEQTLTAAREQLATSMSPADIARLSYDPFGFTELPADAMNAAPAFDQGQELFSPGDGTFRLIYIQAVGELASYRECTRWLTAVKRVVEMARVGNKLSSTIVNYTGRPAFAAEISRGMEHDIVLSVGGTSLIIAALFWLAHRRWKPMLWLLTLLALILAGTLALGGLLFGTINVVSMGFAAILLGLAVDYAVVHYQEALAHPDLSVPQIRRAIAPSIFWAAFTTIAAFLVLNFGGLPGLAQLGSLVGLGVALSACVMIFFFLPPLFPNRMMPGGDAPRGENSPKPDLTRGTLQRPPHPPCGHPLPLRGGEGWGEGAAGESCPPPLHREERTTSTQDRLKAELQTRQFALLRPGTVFLATGLLILLAAGVLLSGLPGMDVTANALRPRGSPSYATLQSIQKKFRQQREPLWLIIGGRNEAEVAARLDAVEPTLNAAVSNRIISGFTLAATLWPRPDRQAANRAVADHLAAQRERLHASAQAGGFTTEALTFTDGILSAWQNAATTTNTFWPTNDMSRWVFEKLIARSPTNDYALGLLYLPTNAPAAAEVMSSLSSGLTRDHVWLSGWELLGSSILDVVRRNLWKLVLPMVGLVLLSLWLAFRRPVEVLLSVGILVLSGFCLLAVMRVCGWSWNLLNLMALPLILGTGVDYSIFMQLGLRRHRGDLDVAHRSVGRALLLCGGTAIAGFGALGFSSNAGMASLGQVCAVGIAGNVLISVYLLPVWWRKLAEGSPSEILDAKPETQLSGPSSLYRAELWRLGLRVVRILPRPVCVALSHVLGTLYWLFVARRREAVIANLLPVLQHDRVAARRKAKSLFQQFAVKIVDLWRYEAGRPIQDRLGHATGWEHFADALAGKRGVLLLTPHLGNWEFGGPWLTQKGVALHVITLAEPGANFTELRQASRARWNIETHVIGSDPFAFLETIRLLESGATVALLMDRPPPATAVTVELFGRPFAASIAAAELARASGCVLLPVVLPREGDAYAAHVLPAIPYERAALRDPVARRDLTQQIVRAFEPAIREHADQWYHFIPIWPK